MRRGLSCTNMPFSGANIAWASFVYSSRRNPLQ